MVNQTPHCRFDLLRADTNIQKRSSTCIKRTAGNGRMDDGLNCGRNVPGSTRQTNALSFYSLGNEVDKGRSRTASLIYKSIVIGIADKIDLQIGVDFFVRTRRQTGRIAKAMWRIEGEVRAKKMRQDGAAEFISASYYNRFIDQGAVRDRPLSTSLPKL